MDNFNIDIEGHVISDPERKGKTVIFEIENDNGIFKIYSSGKLSEIVETYIKIGKKLKISGKHKKGKRNASDIEFIPVKRNSL